MKGKLFLIEWDDCRCDGNSINQREFFTNATDAINKMREVQTIQETTGGKDSDVTAPEDITVFSFDGLASLASALNALNVDRDFRKKVTNNSNNLPNE